MYYTRLDLSRLSKASGPIKSIKTKNTTPGFAIPGYINRQHVLDRNHPAVRLRFDAFPQFTCPDFNIRALPKATLHRKDYIPPNPIPPSPKRAKKDQREISLIFNTFKKNTSNLAVLRSRLRSKMTVAIKLILTRDADGIPTSQSSGTSSGEKVEGPPEHARKPAFTLISRPIPKNYVLTLKDWTYLISPNLSVCRTSLPELVHNVRKAFIILQDQADRLELLWRNPPPHMTRLKRTQDTSMWPKSGPRSTSGAPPQNGDKSLVVSRCPDRPLDRPKPDGTKSFQPRKSQIQPSTQTPRDIPRIFSPSQPTSTVLEPTQNANKYMKAPFSRPGASTPVISPVPFPKFQDRMFTKPPLIVPKEAAHGQKRRRGNE